MSPFLAFKEGRNNGRRFLQPISEVRIKQILWHLHPIRIIKLIVILTKDIQTASHSNHTFIQMAVRFFGIRKVDRPTAEHPMSFTQKI